MKGIYRQNKIFKARLNILSFFFITFLLSILSFSCEDFVDVPPPVIEVVSETVYDSDASAIAAVRGIYAEMMITNFASGGVFSITTLVGLSSDESFDFSGVGDLVEFNTNDLINSNGAVAQLWTQAYTLIYYANSVLEGLNNSNELTSTVKNQLEGESRFIRAFIHFYLVNLYGDIPLITSTDFRINTSVARSPKSEVYQQIIEDLQIAQELLSPDYSFSNGERVQPNQFVATALLARVYLYLEDWTNAEMQASSIINNSILYGLGDDLDNVFLANSQEAIWQLQPVIPGENTKEAQFFINPPEDIPNFQTLTNQLIDAFEKGDERKLNWVDSTMADGTTFYHPFKYKINEPDKPLTEYSMVLRLAEQYLIRAEANAKQNKLQAAIIDVDAIRERAGLPLIQDTNPSISQADMLLAIEQERRVELFTEWGHRWMDLKRTNRIDGVLSVLALKNWQPTDMLYPIPLNEIEVNGNLIQNEGY